MNILKKFLATLIILWLFGQITTNSFASINLSKKTIITEIKWWDKIIAKIDTIIQKLNSKQIEQLKQKLAIIEQSIINRDDITSEKEQKILLIVTYIKLKIEEIYSLNEPSTSVSQTLTADEIKKVNTEIVKVQKNILTHSTVYLENIIGEFEKYTNYQEKGNFKAHLDIDHELIGKMKAELQLNDYEINSAEFDSQLKARMSALISSAPKWTEAVKLEISWMLDFISKDQNYYLLLKELNVVDDWDIDDIEEFIQVMTDIAESNKYVHFEDITSAQTVGMLRSFSPENILNEGNKIASQPLFTVNRKIWNKYYLIPSKYGCDTAKKLAQKFDPFNGDVCTQGQYEDMLQDLEDSKVKFYMELWEYTTLGFDAASIDEELEVLNWNITFSDTHIEKLHFVLTPNQANKPKEWVQMTYLRNQSLTGYMYADWWDINMQLDAILDINNNFETLEMTMKSDDFQWNMSIKNKKIFWKYSAANSTEKLIWSITWSMDSNGNLAELKINNSLENTGNSSPFENTSRFEYAKWQILFVNDFLSEWTKIDLSIWGSWSGKKQELVAWKLSLDIRTKESSYDYDNYKTIYTWDYKKVFNTKMTLKNKGIIGETVVRKDWETVVKIGHSWSYEKDLFTLKNTATINSNVIETMSPLGIYSSQLDKARDSVRITNIMNLRSAIEQSYQDNGEYPVQENFTEQLSPYIVSIPKDPSGNIEINTCKFGYIYEVWADDNGIENQIYKLSTCLESGSNKDKAQNDRGNDELRYEVWIRISDWIYNEKFYINDIQTWEVIKTNTKESSDVKVNTNILIDTRNNANNRNVYIDIFTGLDKMLELEIDNVSNKIYKEINITAPSNTIKLEEVIDTPNYYWY